MSNVTNKGPAFYQLRNGPRKRFIFSSSFGIDKMTRALEEKNRSVDIGLCYWAHFISLLLYLNKKEMRISGNKWGS